MVNDIISSPYFNTITHSSVPLADSEITDYVVTPQIQLALYTYAVAWRSRAIYGLIGTPGPAQGLVGQLDDPSHAERYDARQQIHIYPPAQRTWLSRKWIIQPCDLYDHATPAARSLCTEAFGPWKC